MALFDLDNTLVNRAEAFRRWAVAFAGSHALGDSAVEWLCTRDDDGAATRLDFFAAAREHFHLEPAIHDLVFAYRRDYPEFFAPSPAIDAALERLHAHGWQIGVITNGPSSQVDKLRRSGLDRLVDAWSISEDVGYEKPDPKLFQDAIRRCGGFAEPGQLWMVGDDPVNDIYGGRLVGCCTAWIRRGRSWSNPSFAPHFQVESVKEAVDIMLHVYQERDRDTVVR